MTEFALEVFHNEYLPEGSGDVDAIVGVTATGAATATSGGAGLAEVIMIDCSGSMGDPATKIDAARQATRAALDALPDGTLVAVVAGRHDARMVYPPTAGLVELGPDTRRSVSSAIARVSPSGGTAIGTWLTLARRLLAERPERVRHAILLTDGRNEHENPQDLADAVSAAADVFTCDARGVGTDWVVAEVAGIAAGLLGTADIVAEPADLAADFAGIVASSVGRGVADVGLRVWTPRGAEVLALKQVSPTLIDLTDRRTPDPDRPLLGHYPTGSWGDERREYHLRVRLEPLPAGEEVLAARLAVMVGGAPAGEAGVRAEWTTDATRSARMDDRVAHWTGQVELADAIREGLEARRADDLPRATARLGRAVQIAAESGNAEATAMLARVVDVDDPQTGRVRLRPRVEAADEMTLDVRSTRTARVRES